MIISFGCIDADCVAVGNESITLLSSDLPNTAAFDEDNSVVIVGVGMNCVMRGITGVDKMIAVGVILAGIEGTVVGINGVGVFECVGTEVGVCVGPVIAMVFSADHVGLLQLPVYRPILKRYSPGPL